MSTLAIDKAGPSRKVKLGSMSRDRAWALRWSYFFLILFAIFFLTPPVYMLITSLKSSAEISAATNPWWVFHPTLSNYVELLTSNQFLRFFWNSSMISIIVVIVTMLIEIAMISPPDGTVMYVLQGMRRSPGPITDIFAGVMPFVGVYMLAVLILLLFPGLALVLVPR